MKDNNDLDVWIDHAEDDFNAAAKLPNWMMQKRRSKLQKQSARFLEGS